MPGNNHDKGFGCCPKSSGNTGGLEATFCKPQICFTKLSHLGQVQNRWAEARGVLGKRGNDGGGFEELG